MSKIPGERVQLFTEWDYNIKVAGVKFRQEELSKLYDEDWDKVSVALVPEPDNKFDPNAIKVFFSDVHVGYIPATVAQAFKESDKQINNFKCALIYITDGERNRFRTAKIALKET